MGRRVLGSLFDNVFGLITIVLSVVCGISFLALNVHPTERLFFQWISLFLPALLVINIGLLLYWLLRRKRWFLFPLLALIANSWYYPSVFNFFSDYINDISKNNIVVATYNVNSFWEKSIGSTVYHISDLVNERKVDILCVQEVPQNFSTDSLLTIFPFYPYIALTEPVGDRFGMMILSKYPIISSEVISFSERPNCVLRADLDVLGNRVSIFNCHLQTTNWNQRHFLRFSRKLNSVIRQKEIMENNFILRARQTDKISDIIHSSPYPVIVCGDFNDTPSSYVYHQMKGSLHDSFRFSNNYYSYTYRDMYKLLRIDYLFYSPDTFSGKKYESPNVSYSDHNPIIVTFGLKN